MIVRYWRGLTSHESAEPYVRHLQDRIFPEIRAIEGFRHVRLLRREVDRGIEFLVLTLWESMDAIRSFAGEETERAVVPPEAQALLIEFDPFVKHFQLVEEGK